MNTLTTPDTTGRVTQAPRLATLTADEQELQALIVAEALPYEFEDKLRRPVRKHEKLWTFRLPLQEAQTVAEVATDYEFAFMVNGEFFG